MAKYRTLKTVSYVKDGAVVTVGPNRFVELNEKQAEALGETAVERSRTEDAMFPDGAPIFSPGFAPEVEVPAVDPKELVSGLPAPKKK